MLAKNLLRCMEIFYDGVVYGQIQNTQWLNSNSTGRVKCKNTVVEMVYFGNLEMITSVFDISLHRERNLK